MSGVLSLKPSYYEALRRLTLELAGINLGKDHPFLIETRLRTLARQEGYDSLLHMVEELFGQGQARLALQVVSSLLERDTHFNPDPQNIQQLEKLVLPALANNFPDQTIRILSFGCSSGQETYSLAMQVDKCRSQFPSLKFDIVGVDYPSRAIERAKRGQYTHFEVQRGLPIRDLVAYFDRRGEDWIVKQSLRNQVSFQEHHLLSNLSGLGTFHIAILRNRLESYTSGAQLRVLRGLSSIILPSGYLMLGVDEKIPVAGYGFEEVQGAPGLFERGPNVEEEPEQIVEEAPVRESRPPVPYVPQKKMAQR